MIKRLAIGALIGCAALVAPSAFSADQPGAGKLEAAFKKADADKDDTVS